MKVAFVSAISAVPANEGNRSRILQLTRAVRRLGHDVHFVYIDTPIIADFDPAAHEAEFGSGHLHFVSRQPGGVKHGLSRIWVSSLGSQRFAASERFTGFSVTIVVSTITWTSSIIRK